MGMNAVYVISRIYICIQTTGKSAAPTKTMMYQHLASKYVQRRLLQAKSHMSRFIEIHLMALIELTMKNLKPKDKLYRVTDGCDTI
jgi:hypothetical protein